MTNEQRQKLAHSIVGAMRVSTNEEAIEAIQGLSPGGLVVLAVELGVLSPPPPEVLRQRAQAYRDGLSVVS